MRCRWRSKRSSRFAMPSSGMPMAGRTDAWILADARPRTAFLATPRTSLASATPTSGTSSSSSRSRARAKGVMPGVRELLDVARQPRRRLQLALLDRQLRGGRAHQARILRSVALLSVRRVRRRRAEPQRPGAESARARGGVRRAAFAAADAVVIGDTPLDVGVRRRGRCAIDRGRDGQSHGRRTPRGGSRRRVMKDLGDTGGGLARALRISECGVAD